MNKTDYLKLSQPQQGETNWGNAINNNFGTIDLAYKQLQSSIAALEKVNRQEGYFNFIDEYDYILLNSTKLKNNSPLLPDTIDNNSTNIGSSFVIVGSNNQALYNGNYITYFYPKRIYYFGENWKEIKDKIKTPEEDSNISKTLSIKEPTDKGWGELQSVHFLHYILEDDSSLYIKTKYTTYEQLCVSLEDVESFIFLDNNTGFYNFSPASGYSNINSHPLYQKDKYYEEHELIIKYVNYGDVVFTSYSNAVGGVYVPQKELNSDVITFVRTPVVNSERTITASLNPYYVYGGIYDVDFSEITKSGDGYSIEIPNSKIVGKSTSNNDKISLQNVSLEFYDKTNGYSKVIVDYKISLGQGNLNLTVYGISETNKNKLLARVTYLSTQITDVLAEKYVEYGNI